MQQRLRMLFIAGCALAITVPLATGCSKSSEPTQTANNNETAKTATNTTAARGVMHAGARGRKHR